MNARIWIWTMDGSEHLEFGLNPSRQCRDGRSKQAPRIQGIGLFMWMPTYIHDVTVHAYSTRKYKCMHALLCAHLCTNMHAVRANIYSCMHYCALTRVQIAYKVLGYWWELEWHSMDSSLSFDEFEVFLPARSKKNLSYWLLVRLNGSGDFRAIVIIS